jgi:hypothetical protein
MLDNIPLIISEEDNLELMKPIEEEEIMKAIWDLELDKAPESDGFSISYRSFFFPLVKCFLYLQGYILLELDQDRLKKDASILAKDWQSWR